MLLTRSNPFDLFDDLDRAFQRTARSQNPANGWYPVDVTENDTAYVVEAELPGYTRDQVKVTLEEGVLTIEADRTTTRTETKAVENQATTPADEPATETQPEVTTPSIHLHERRAQRVLRRFRMPSELDADRIEARLENGLLTLTLPKHEQTLPRQIEIR
ncbi:Hsp20/alpha crystallin family protein [Mucisphaera sp.]|uniref:Hsp20/alpha crystallin family protein n=1 Tax=Mucisphaera sp. TaxID=2913024 RepID=UPI003D100524